MVASTLFSKFVIETKQLEVAVSVPAGGYESIILDISKTGYTPKMLSNANPWNTNLIVAFCYLDGNNAEFSIYNTSSGALNSRPRVTVLYEKN